jgi:hypothetical protein
MALHFVRTKSQSQHSHTYFRPHFKDLLARTARSIPWERYCISVTARQIRRAAERKARKDARREPNGSAVNSSTGPRTEEGKAIASQNALKNGLTGRTVLLPTDDVARYERHLAHYHQLWNPVGEHECVLVQAPADTWWRLQPIPMLEAALYSKGRTEFTDCAPNLVELETYLAYERHFRNLALQERRLSNYANRLKLEQMQAKREPQLEAECSVESSAEKSRQPAPSQPIEDSNRQFEFSTFDSMQSADFSHAVPVTPLATSARNSGM